MWSEASKFIKCPPGVGTVLLITSKGEDSLQPEAKEAETWTLKHLDGPDTHSLTKPYKNTQSAHTNCRQTKALHAEGMQIHI